MRLLSRSLYKKQEISYISNIEKQAYPQILSPLAHLARLEAHNYWCSHLPSPGDPLNLMELLKLSIPQKIGTKYMMFGILLLEDEMAARVNTISKKCQHDAEQINLEILRQWLEGSGKTPIAWGTLADVLCMTGLGTLGEEIRATKCQK